MPINIPLTIPDASSDAASCFKVLQSHNYPVSCSTSVEKQYNITFVPRDQNQTITQKLCDATTQVLHCLNRYVCSVCTYSQALDIEDWETPEVKRINETYCLNGNVTFTMPTINWCQVNLTDPYTTAVANQTGAIIAMIVITLIIVILGIGAIVCLFTRQDVEEIDKEKKPVVMSAKSASAKALSKLEETKSKAAAKIKGKSAYSKTGSMVKSSVPKSVIKSTVVRGKSALAGGKSAVARGKSQSKSDVANGKSALKTSVAASKSQVKSSSSKAAKSATKASSATKAN